MIDKVFPIFCDKYWFYHLSTFTFLISYTQKSYIAYKEYKGCVYHQILRFETDRVNSLSTSRCTFAGSTDGYQTKNMSLIRTRLVPNRASISCFIWTDRQQTDQRHTEGKKKTDWWTFFVFTEAWNPESWETVYFSDFSECNTKAQVSS